MPTNNPIVLEFQKLNDAQQGTVIEVAKNLENILPTLKILTSEIVRLNEVPSTQARELAEAAMALQKKADRYFKAIRPVIPYEKMDAATLNNGAPRKIIFP